MTYNLKQMNKQEVLDAVVAHLLTQNEKSYGGDGWCAYRGEKGLKCAAGIFIPDDIYNDVEMEKHPWQVLISIKGIPRRHHKLVAQCQVIHDNDKVDEWKEALKELAKTRGLKFNKPKLSKK